MKIPSEVVWQLTKKYNSFLVKFNGQQLSRDPLNLTNFHNASQAGISNDRSIGLSVAKSLGKKKGSKRVITLLQKHKTHNKVHKARKGPSTSGALASRVVLKRGINRIGKVV